ncbi:hypothetical protein QBC37DRAFT_292882 [Rhypophila decipiens]|uniref:Uncharacterized protein n=1 Tax=Rhypophila decipiens TaxID=261697 RepID=A0AAN6Y1D6_9PEZI|nr:hypothetical protein QBC37DRAFT_292882 [Rhypophila decipiens]
MTEPNSTTVATLTTAWQSEPNGRGTFSLIISCLLTLTLCVWSALHLNVPGQKTSLRSRILEKTKWVLYGIFAPELVVATAAAQFITARWLRKQIELDSKYRLSRSDKSKGMSTRTWTLSQCFYAVMGGFAADSPWVDFRTRCRADVPANSQDDTEGGCSVRKRAAITAEGVRLMSFLGRLPHIHEAQIQDKSKADWMAKSLICIQVGWMVVQVIGRVIKKMPVSLLEINTCGHVVCAMAIYLLWWSKPLEIQEPTLLNDDQDQDALALMYMCSSIGAVDGITDIRCFIHVVTEEDERYWRLLPKTPDSAPETGASEMQEITTILSIGSPGAIQPGSFLGFRDLRSGEDQFVALPKLRPNRNRQKEPRNSAYIYKFNYNNPPISKDCRVYYSPPYTDDPMASLRHSWYCRRLLNEQASDSPATKSQPPHIPVPIALVRSASKAADILRAECSADRRPSYTPYYFTHVRPPMGEFLGETEYIIRGRIPNFPSLHNLGLGQVNIHRDRLRSVLALTAAGYGALHCAGWPSNTSGSSGSKYFPTNAERILWIVSSLTIAASGALLWVYYLAREFLPVFDRWVSGVVPGEYIQNEGIRKRRLRRVNRLVDVGKQGSVYFVLGVFALARVYLVVEAFVSLRDAPVGLYKTPEWTDFLPHF